MQNTKYSTFASRICLTVLLSLGVGSLYAEQVKVPVGYEVPCGSKNFYPHREKPAPLLDTPLRHPHILHVPDGNYYLTGTKGRPEGKGMDFDHCDGVYLWRSSDIKNWTDLGKVFDVSESNPAFASAWWGQPVPDGRDPGHLDRAPIRGVVAPRIHYFNDTYWIVFGIGSGGVGLLKSETGKPEGPYVDSGQLAAKGGHPFLFEDGGTVYLLWGRGLLAPLKDDLSGLAGPSVELVVQPSDGVLDWPRSLGREGFALFKRNDRYWLTAVQVTEREMRVASDVFVASSDKLTGTYDRRRWMIPNSGGVSVFQGPENRLYATVWGNDEESACSDRVGVVPLIWSTDPCFWHQRPKFPFPRIAAGVHTERGAWDEILPISPLGMRDVGSAKKPCKDGYVYFTGSAYDPLHQGKLVVLRSKNLVDWEEHVLLTLEDIPWLSSDSKKHRRELIEKGKGIFSGCFMDIKISLVRDTFYVFYGIYNIRDNQFLDEEGKRHHGRGWLRSRSGKIEGPWEDLGIVGRSQASLFEDDDSKVYMTSGRDRFADMPKDLAAGPMLDTERQILAADGSYTGFDVATTLLRVEGKYVFCTRGNAHSVEPKFLPGDDGIISYNYVYKVADNLAGPWSRGRLINEQGGHGGVSYDAQGRLWGMWFGCEMSPAFNRHIYGPAGVAPLEVFFDNRNELIIRVASKLPEDYRQLLDAKRATYPKGLFERKNYQPKEK